MRSRPVDPDWLYWWRAKHVRNSLERKAVVAASSVTPVHRPPRELLDGGAPGPAYLAGAAEALRGGDRQ